MTEVPDARLLEQFARSHSEEAFAALVQRYIALVHSVALRHTANPQHAEDITQAVFIILARKARTLVGGWQRRLVAAVRFRGDGGVAATSLAGWLYHTARLTAANLQRAEMRRVRREQEAFMQSTLEESPTDALWRELSAQLDEAMAGLGAGERDVLVLRYFQNKSMAEVGQYLGLAENTAQKRVGRALEKLRKFFAKQGVDSTPASIAETISTHSVQAVPIALAKSITAVALAKGTTTSISTLTLVKGALKIMAWTKAKTAVAVGTAVVLSVGTFTGVKTAIHRHTVERGKLILSQVPLTTQPPFLRPAKKHFAEVRVASKLIRRGNRKGVHLDTTPDSPGIAERRSPIRRVSGHFVIHAGSETGASGEVPSCTPERRWRSEFASAAAWRR
jgi:RNA polymerase sigma factor (sigma-70 family)